MCRENSGEAPFEVEEVGVGLAGKLPGVPTGMLLNWGTTELVRKLPSGYTEAHSSFSVLIMGCKKTKGAGRQEKTKPLSPATSQQFLLLANLSILRAVKGGIFIKSYHSGLIQKDHSGLSTPSSVQ